MILVTGASGFIGGHLVNALIQRNEQVRALIRSNANLPFPREKVEIYFGDITDENSLIGAMKNIDTIFHLASVINLKTETMASYRAINNRGTQNIFKAVNVSETRLKHFVFCSSVGVFGSLETVPANEETICHPVNYYEKSKLETEEIVHAQGAAMRIPVSIVRPSWVYGPGDKRTFKLFRSIDKKRFMMIGKGNTKIHPVFVTDLVLGMLQCIFGGKGETGDTFIIAGKQSISLKRLVDTIADALGRKIPGIYAPVFMARVIASVLEKAYGPLHKIPPISHRRLDFFLKNQAFDISKAERMIDYYPKVDLETGVLQTVTWYRDHGWL